ncbi:MAG TPA: GNAT family N-acetyltransferase [Phycisphaerae bacterium]|nr:GNAT family N-acetyltransferase [Phycisphaerae bacterium]
MRPMTPADRIPVAELVHHSTNAWYTSHGRPAIFRGDPGETALFFDVYHALPGSAGIVAEDPRNDQLTGSCFYHVRPTHVSLGIMNVHPDHFGRGIAGDLLDRVIEIAEREAKPLRLVSSAVNLDSFSLYTRKGFVPRVAYQDMYLKVSSNGVGRLPLSEKAHPATLEDVARIAELELAVNHTRRDGDYRHFIENPEGIWHVSVLEGKTGQLDGFLASCAHPASRMIGPGAARTEQQAAALILAELDRHRGHTPVFLVPVHCADLVREMYALGARNCELHFQQVRGHWPGLDGVNMPTFMPETC